MIAATALIPAVDAGPAPACMVTMAAGSQTARCRVRITGRVGWSELTGAEDLAHCVFGSRVAGFVLVYAVDTVQSWGTLDD